MSEFSQQPVLKELSSGYTPVMELLPFAAASLFLRVIRCLALACILSALPGCVRTVISSKPLPAQILRLSRLNEKALHLRVVEGPSTKQTAGHQFLAFIIPFGTVTVATAAEQIWNAAALQLTLAGTRLAPAEERGVPVLQITVDRIALNAFDLLVTRRVAADVTLSATWRGNEAHAQASAAEFKRMGFAPQLQAVLERASALAVQNVLEKVGVAK